MPIQTYRTRSASQNARAEKDIIWPAATPPSDDIPPEEGLNRANPSPAQLGSFGGGSGFNSAPAVLPPPAPLSPTEAANIRKTYTEISGGVWVPGVKAWTAKQTRLKTGSTAVPIRADGNCMYWGIVEANNRQSFFQGRGRRGEAAFVQFKKATEKYYDSAEFYFLRQNPAFNNLFPVLRFNLEREPAEAKDIEDHFDTDNRSASLAVCQLSALALKVDIHIQCLSRLDDGPIVLPGGLPTAGESRPTVRLLLRENNLPIYDGHFVQIGLSEGHFWFEDRPTAAPGGQVSADGPAEGSAPTHPISPGNGTGSALIRP